LDIIKSSQSRFIRNPSHLYTFLISVSCDPPLQPFPPQYPKVGIRLRNRALVMEEHKPE